MTKKTWILAIIAVVVVGGGSFWGGMTYAQNSQASSASSRFAASGSFAGRSGAGGFAGAGGGATAGTVVQVGTGSFTVQLPYSTSTTATTGTKLVLVNSVTQVDELESVPVSNIQVGQSVTVTGTSNSDGSVTASTVMVRPSATGGSGGPAIQTQ